MPYLQSHRGDYLSGYQGGIGSFLGGLVKGAARIGSRLLGGPAGLAVGAATTAVATRSTNGRQPQIRIPLPGPYAAKPGSILPGGKPFIVPDVSQELPPRGYRLNKTGYWLKSGEFVPPRSRYVKVRRRNFANSRALRRAISRTQGFNRLVKSSRKSLRELSRI